MFTYHKAMNLLLTFLHYNNSTLRADYDVSTYKLAKLTVVVVKGYICKYIYLFNIITNILQH